MPTVFRANIDGSQATRHFPVSLTIYFLRQAQSHCLLAINARNSETAFKQSLTSILFSCMFLESFVNEMAEIRYSGDELERFIQQRKEFAAEEGISKTSSKFRALFRLLWSVELPVTAAPLREIEELFELRNELMHYKLSKSAGKVQMVPGQVQISRLGYFVSFDLTKAEGLAAEPLVAKVNAITAIKSFNAALDLAITWHHKANAPADALQAFMHLSLDMRRDGLWSRAKAFLTRACERF